MASSRTTGSDPGCASNTIHTVVSRRLGSTGFDRLSERQKELLRMQKGLGHPTSSDYDEV